MSCGVGRRCRSDPTLLWLWCRATAMALMRSLAWEPPYSAGVALKNQKKKKKRGGSWSFPAIQELTQSFKNITAAPLLWAKPDVDGLSGSEASFRTWRKTVSPMVLLPLCPSETRQWPVPSVVGFVSSPAFKMGPSRSLRSPTQTTSLPAPQPEAGAHVAGWVLGALCRGQTLRPLSSRSFPGARILIPLNKPRCADRWPNVAMQIGVVLFSLWANIQRDTEYPSHCIYSKRGETSRSFFSNRKITSQHISRNEGNFHRNFISIYIW